MDATLLLRTFVFLSDSNGNPKYLTTASILSSTSFTVQFTNLAANEHYGLFLFGGMSYFLEETSNSIRLIPLSILSIHEYSTGNADFDSFTPQNSYESSMGLFCMVPSSYPTVGYASQVDGVKSSQIDMISLQSNKLIVNGKWNGQIYNLPISQFTNNGFTYELLNEINIDFHSLSNTQLNIPITLSRYLSSAFEQVDVLDHSGETSRTADPSELEYLFTGYTMNSFSYRVSTNPSVAPEWTYSVSDSYSLETDIPTLMTYPYYRAQFYEFITGNPLMTVIIKDGVLTMSKKVLGTTSQECPTGSVRNEYQHFYRASTFHYIAYSTIHPMYSFDYSNRNWKLTTQIDVSLAGRSFISNISNFDNTLTRTSSDNLVSITLSDNILQDYEIYFTDHVLIGKPDQNSPISSVSDLALLHIDDLGNSISGPLVTQEDFRQEIDFNVGFCDEPVGSRVGNQLSYFFSSSDYTIEQLPEYGKRLSYVGGVEFVNDGFLELKYSNHEYLQDFSVEIDQSLLRYKEPKVEWMNFTIIPELSLNGRNATIQIDSYNSGETVGDFTVELACANPIIINNPSNQLFRNFGKAQNFTALFEISNDFEQCKTLSLVSTCNIRISVTRQDLWSNSLKELTAVKRVAVDYGYFIPRCQTKVNEPFVWIESMLLETPYFSLNQERDELSNNILVNLKTNSSQSVLNPTIRASVIPNIENPFYSINEFSQIMQQEFITLNFSITSRNISRILSERSQNIFYSFTLNLTLLETHPCWSTEGKGGIFPFSFQVLYECPEGYTGSQCDIPICYGLNSTNSNVCSGNGNCISPNRCECFANYTEGNCSIPLCFGIRGDSPDVCSSEGRCVQANVCSCEDGHVGFQCEIPKCFNVAANESLVCSGHGDCLEVNNCSCSESFFGDNCEFSNNISNNSLSNSTTYTNESISVNETNTFNSSTPENSTDSVDNSTSYDNSSFTSNSTLSKNTTEELNNNSTTMDSNQNQTLMGDNSTNTQFNSSIPSVNETTYNNNSITNSNNETISTSINGTSLSNESSTQESSTTLNATSAVANSSLNCSTCQFTNETERNSSFYGNETSLMNDNSTSINGSYLESNNVTILNENVTDSNNETNLESNSSLIIERNETLNNQNDTDITSNTTIITNNTLNNNETSNLGHFNDSNNLNTSINPANLTNPSNNSSLYSNITLIPDSSWSCNTSTTLSKQFSGNGYCSENNSCSCNDGFSGKQCQFTIYSSICSGSFNKVSQIISKNDSIYLERLLMDKTCGKTIPLDMELILGQVSNYGLNLSVISLTKLYSVYLDSNGNQFISFDSRLLSDSNPNSLIVWRVDSQDSSISKLSIPINYGIHNELSNSKFGLIKFVKQNDQLFALSIINNTSTVAIFKVDLARMTANISLFYEKEFLTFSNIANGNLVNKSNGNKELFTVIVKNNEFDSTLLRIDLSGEEKQVSELEITKLPMSDNSFSIILENPSTGEQFLLSSGQEQTVISSIRSSIDSEIVNLTILAIDSDFTVSKSDTVVVEQIKEGNETKVVILNVDTGISLTISTNRLVSSREILSESSQKLLLESPTILSIGSIMSSSNNVETVSLSISSMSSFDIPISSSVQIQIEGKLILTGIKSFIVFKHEESGSFIEKVPIQRNSRARISYYFVTKDVSNNLPEQLCNSKKFNVKVYIMLTNNVIEIPFFVSTNLEITMFRFELENISPKIGFYGNQLLLEFSHIPKLNSIDVKLKIADLSNSELSLQCKVLNFTHCSFDIPQIDSIDTIVYIRTEISDFGLETQYDSNHFFRYIDPSIVNIKDLTHFDTSITFPDIPFVNSSSKPIISFIPTSEGSFMLFEMNKIQLSNNNKTESNCGKDLIRQIVGSSDIFNISNSISLDVKLSTFSNIENGNLFEAWISKSQNATFFAYLTISNGERELTIGQLNITKDSQLIKKSVNCLFESNHLYHLTVLVKELQVDWELKDVELNIVACSAQYSKDNSKLLSNNQNVKGYQVAIGQSFECSQLISDTAQIPTLALSGMKEVCISCKIMNFLSAEKETLFDSFLGGIIGGVGGFLLLSLTSTLTICCIIRKKRQAKYNYVYHQSRNFKRNQTIQDLFSSSESQLGTSEDFDIVDEHSSYLV